VSFYDWLLFLHVASAFALVSALVTFWVIAVAARNVDRPVESLRYFRVAQPANVLVIVGTLGTFAFGVWLALYVDGYELWDGWILAGLVLWAIGAYTGFLGGKPYMEASRLAGRLAGEGRGEEQSAELRTLLQDRRGMWLNVVSTLAVVAVLVDMIYKPGA
jgi:uncharacterized membrane protein